METVETGSENNYNSSNKNLSDCNGFIWVFLSKQASWVQGP